MAEPGRRCIGPLVFAVLLAGAFAPARAQMTAWMPDGADEAGQVQQPKKQAQAGGSIVGKLTDLGSAPLAGATIVVRNDATGAEAHTVTAKNGSYRLTGLSTGTYSLVAQSPELGRGRLEGIYVSGGGYEARVQAAIELLPIPVTHSVASDAVKQLAGNARQTAELVRHIPSAAMPVANPSATIDGALKGNVALPGGLAASPKRMETAYWVAALASEPLFLLPLSGHAVMRALAAGGSASGKGSSSAPGSELAVSRVAISAVQASLQAIGPQSNPAETALQRVDPVTPVVATSVSSAELQSLPLAGRRWQDFVLDTPTASTTSAGAQDVALRGAALAPTETRLDGAGASLAFGGSGRESGLSGSGLNGAGPSGASGSDEKGMGQVWASGRGSPIAEAAIRQVQTEAGNAEAEGARTAGGLLTVETAHGLNGLHGQGFLFDRQNTWGAQNPFTQWVKESAPATVATSPVFTAESYTPPDHEIVWGLGAGSQIRRDKLFWFGAVDSYDRNDPGLAMVRHPDQFFAHPSNDEMQVLAARLGLSSANPVAEGLGAYSQMLGTLDGLLGPAPRQASQWVGFGRLDWKATERHRFTLEATGAHWNSPGGGLTRVSEAYGANSFGTSQASDVLVLGRWEAFLTPNLLVVTQGSLGRTIQSAHAETPSAFEKTFLTGNSYGQLPQIAVDPRFGFTIGNPSRFGTGNYPDEHQYLGQQEVEWVRSGLMIKAGVELGHNADATSLLRNETGTYSYSSVENFVSDALAFSNFGTAGQLQLDNQHNCDQTGTVWRDSTGTLHGLGNLPCYSYYSQMIGPTNWNLSTNDWAVFSTFQWQASKLLVVSGGLRWEREQLPPPIAWLNNPDLPLTAKLPSLGNDWGPRISMALGSPENHWPVLRLGYGMYFGRTENAMVETALTQTGSAKGDLSIFMRPTDDCQFCAGGAPAFPSVLTGAPGSMVTPSAVEFSPNFRNAEVHQAVAAVEEVLPGRIEVTGSALVSLGRRLPSSIDANIDPAVNPGTITYNVCDQDQTGPAAPNSGQCGNLGLGPIPTSAPAKFPFYALWPSVDCPAGEKLNLSGECGRLDPNYQQVVELFSRANSTYEAAVIKVDRYGRRGVSLHAHYAYAHAMDWNPGQMPLQPTLNNFKQEYGTSDLDVRHSAALIAVVQAPWKLDGKTGQAANGWMVSGIGQYRSGLPYTMRTSGSIPEEFDAAGNLIIGMMPGMNGSGGDNRVYGVGRNTYRYPTTWKADLRIGKKFDLGRTRQLELLVESFNLFNHQNVTELESTGYFMESGTPPGTSGTSATLPTLNFLTGLKINPVTGLPITAFGQPLNVNATNFYRERQIQVGARFRF